MTLHPFVATMLATQKEAGAPALSDATPAQARALVEAGRAAIGPGPEMARSREVAVPTRGGSLTARLHVPHGDVTGLVVYLHGGGWVVGTVDDYDTLGRELAHRSRCAVLLPDYRLAPEHPFPSGLEDTEDVLTWVGGEAEFSGLPLVVAGDSAGANLATVAVRRLRGQVTPALQVLVYPVTDGARDTESYRDCAEGLGLGARDMAWFFDHYAPARDHLSPDVAPLRAGDLAGLPPTAVVTAEYDVLRSEGEAYAERLRAAGVDVTSKRYPGVTHGFLRLHNHLDVARDAVADIADAITTAVAAATPLTEETA
ncbi:alpha/beta hydrolase [Pseudonocardia sp. KRD291]|uniref:alpha/beta hydrolase n=1 Tax=Pseudonocardia sp. KRD291 TaxID=2792007 RepID=UPI001C49DB5E|nr:alpha/beta hydrolase [Pseudonocardia sp. KRD291]MBW0103141.1 alpha/beta hydrolase [Pseudonocardia sp. KRD291]